MTVAGELVRLRRADLPELRARFRELTGEALKTDDQESAWRAVARAIQGQGAPYEVESVSSPAVVTPHVRPRHNAAKPKRVSGKSRRPTVATVMVRVWHGVEHRITIVERGYSLDGVVFKTASALARHVTGQHWNGRLWLGLKKRSQKAKR